MFTRISRRVASLFNAHTSKVLAFFVAFLVVMWVATGKLEYRDISEYAETEQPSSLLQQGAQVRYVESVAVQHQKTIELSGVTRPDAIISVRSEVSGQVVAVNKNLGDFVTKGTSLAQVDVREHEARRNELSAKVAQLELELKVAEQLSDKGFQSEVQLAQKKAQLASAQTAVDLLILEEERSQIAVPIDGYYQERFVEVGTLLSKGSEVAQIAALDPLVIEVSMSESEIRQVNNETQAVVLIEEVSYPAEIIRISAIADEKTRAFQVEVKIDNSDASLKGGYSATVRFATAIEPAHKTQPSWVVLSDEGEMGFKVIDTSGSVVFKPIAVIDNSEDELWVTGLEDESRIITLGFEHASNGSQPAGQVDQRYAQ